MHKDAWEIESIKTDIDNKADFISKFIIYDDSKLIRSHYFKIEEVNDFISAIKDSKISTGIMISIMKIKYKLIIPETEPKNDYIKKWKIYICILDKAIFIIKQRSLSAFQEYFNEHLDLLIFISIQCKENFMNDLSPKTLISEQNDQILKIQKDDYIAIIDEIIECTIKKSQYRTIKMRQELNPDKYNSKNDNYYKLDDFILIQSQDFRLYYNSKDQILNILKFYSDDKKFKHEIEFYHQIENTFPFIRKFFGIIKRQLGLPIIILEYVEGEILDKFILNEKEIEFKTQIKMIEDILFSIYYVHSNGFYLRDLKPNNIIVDSQNDAILIDFDSVKDMYSSNEEENTGNIGNSVYTAPEQFSSNEYTYKVDSYSVGMIIHLIISRQKYNFSNEDLLEIYKKKDNISKNYKIPKLPKEYEFILSIYEKCFEISPNSRPSITSLIIHIIFDNNNDQLKSVNEIELPYIIKQIENYESVFKIAYKYIYEKPIERSYLHYFLGYIYYRGKYVLQNIDKAIIYLEKASNNLMAQFFLGEIYYLGEYVSQDINKSIHYFTLSANQNNSDAQYYLGKIYYLGEYISRDINKSIYYLTLSANQNNSNAQCLLGEIYCKGEYISRDFNKTIYYLTLSANQNNSYAQYYLGHIYYIGEYVSRDINKSIYYLTLSANQNNRNAQYYLGEIYYLGEYISRDINKLIHYLTLSANQNHSDAQCLLGEIYYDGKYIGKNIKKSIHYFKESSCFNNGVAKNYLGIIYKNGDGVEKNIYYAKIYFKEAIKQEEPYSMYNLARIYYFGLGMERKISKAISLLEKDQINIFQYQTYFTSSQIVTINTF